MSKTRNGSQWTEARFRSFIKSALRGAQWPPKYEAVRKAYVKEGNNPRTGRRCKLHRCANCMGLFPQKDVQADHIDPVIGPEGFVNWDTYIARLYCEVEGFRVLCKECHRKVTGMERFGVDETGFARRDAVRTFKNLNVQSMRSFMLWLGLDDGGTVKQMTERYEKHLDQIHESAITRSQQD